MKGEVYLKFACPSACHGKTAFPNMPAALERFGIWFDYDTVVNRDGTDFHLFKMQPNKGKIPSSIKAFRDKHGTHAVMATVLVKKGANAKEVEAALNAARKEFNESF